jgi:hypothetical protein
VERALQRGLQSGANKRTAEAQIMLGRAYLKLNQKDAARRLSRRFRMIPSWRASLSSTIWHAAQS